MRRHATLDATLDPNLRLNIPLKRGKDGENYFVMSHEFHAHYFSAHCDVSLWFEGRHHGSVKITYL
jgi:hypothetical protein